MRVVYGECVENKGPGITKRSLARIRDVLSDTDIDSPFASLAQTTAKWFISMDKRNIGDKVQKSVSHILDKVHGNMDELLSERVEDESEIAARARVQELLPCLLDEWEQADKDLQALMAKYGLQPKFGRPQMTAKGE